MRPLGWPGADFQGPIAASGLPYDPRNLLVPGVRSFQFDHLLQTDDTFDPWVISRRASPYIDTDGGLDGYLSRASKSGRQNMSQARRRVAKAQRELGPLRFEADTVDEKLLDQVIDLKRGQYAATGVRDYFADARRVALLHHLLHTRETAFSGILSGVYAGDRLLAAHFGIRADGVLHWWFPVYDPELSSLAPGWILLRELVIGQSGTGHHPDRSRSRRGQLQAVGQDRRGRRLRGTRVQEPGSFPCVAGQSAGTAGREGLRPRAEIARRCARVAQS